MVTSSLPSSTPEEQGISSEAVLQFVTTVERDVHDLHSFMLLRHGQVAASGWWSPYAPQRPHMLFSLSKSFTSAAVGLAVAEGRLTVEDRVLSFFPEDAPVKVSPHLAAMRVRDLLTMTTGHAKDATGRAQTQKEGNWARGFLSLPARYAPGTHFVYNSAATYMLSAIVQKLSGMTLLDYLRPRLFEPLGIANPAWESCPRGINTGGWGLSVRTEDIARFGQLYLQKGVWQGQRILPEAWVSEATSRQVPNGSDPDSDWDQGYGYQFWRCRHNIYRGDGAFGQYCIVMPDQDAVLAITSGLDDMQPVLNIVWEHLLPAFQPAPLAPDQTAQTRLAQKLSCLELLLPQGDHDSPTAERVSRRPYALKKNKPGIQQIRFDFLPGRSALTVQAAEGAYSIACGLGEWIESFVPMQNRGLQPAVASSVWTAENIFVITLRFVETPFCQTMICSFEENRLNIEIKLNVNLSHDQLGPPLLVGKMI